VAIGSDHFVVAAALGDHGAVAVPPDPPGAPMYEQALVVLDQRLVVLSGKSVDCLVRWRRWACAAGRLDLYHSANWPASAAIAPQYTTSMTCSATYGGRGQIARRCRSTRLRPGRPVDGKRRSSVLVDPSERERTRSPDRLVGRPLRIWQRAGWLRR
jgi:hypothetical protein